MKGIIWYYKNVDKGKNLLKDIIQKYERMKVEILPFRGQCIERKDYMRVAFNNGDIWEVTKAGEYEKGKACNIGYISHSIPEEIVRQMLISCIKAYPYQGYRYWDEEDWLAAAITSDNPES